MHNMLNAGSMGFSAGFMTMLIADWWLDQKEDDGQAD